jgi:hypothetical protein
MENIELVGTVAADAVSEIQKGEFVGLAAQLFRLCCYDPSSYSTEPVLGVDGNVIQGRLYKWSDGSSCYVPQEVLVQIWGA